MTTMRIGRLPFLCLIFISVLLPSSALAYIGPGAGLSAIGTFLAVIGAIFLLIVGFVWYPMKRLLRWWKTRNNTEKNTPADSGT